MVFSELFIGGHNMLQCPRNAKNVLWEMHCRGVDSPLQNNQGKEKDAAMQLGASILNFGCS